MKNVFSILILSMILVSCERRIGGPVPDTLISISYTDNNNADLLNPKTPAFINEDDIEVYQLTQKGERRRVYNGRMDMPKMFRIEQRESDMYLLTTSFEPDQDCFNNKRMATMYMTYKNRGEDKFVGQFNRTKFPRTLQKLWVNDKLVSDNSSLGSQRKITLIK